MENPALAARGVPNTDQAGGSIAPEHATPHLRIQQVSRLRRYAVNSAMAETLAPLVFNTEAA